MMTWKTRLLHFERMCDGLVEHFLLQHKILGFLLIFIGMPLVTLSAVCICSTVLGTAAGLGVWVPVKRALIQF